MSKYRCKNVDDAWADIQEQKRKFSKQYTYEKCVRIVKEKLEDGTTLVLTKMPYRKSQKYIEGFYEACDRYQGYMVELLNMKGEIELKNYCNIADKK